MNPDAFAALRVRVLHAIQPLARLSECLDTIAETMRLPTTPEVDAPLVAQELAESLDCAQAAADELAHLILELSTQAEHVAPRGSEASGPTRAP